MLRELGLLAIYVQTVSGSEGRCLDLLPKKEVPTERAVMAEGRQVAAQAQGALVLTVSWAQPCSGSLSWPWQRAS